MGRLHGALMFALATRNPAIPPKLMKENVGKRNKHNGSKLSLRMQASTKQMNPVAINQLTYNILIRYLNLCEY